MTYWENGQCKGFVFDLWQVIARQNSITYSVIPISSTTSALAQVNGSTLVDVSITFRAFIPKYLALPNISYSQALLTVDFTVVLFDRSKFKKDQVSLIYLVFTRPVGLLLLSMSIVIMGSAIVAFVIDRRTRKAFLERPEKIHLKMFGLLLEYSAGVMNRNISNEVTARVRLLQLIIAATMFIVIPIFEAMLSSSLTVYEARGQPITASDSRIQKSVLLCDSDAADTIREFMLARGVTLVVVENVRAAVAAYASDQTKPPGASAVDGFVSSTQEINVILAAEPRIDPNAILIMVPFSPGGLDVPKGFAMTKQISGWLMPIVDVALSGSRESGQMAQLLSAYLPSIQKPTTRAKLDVPDTIYNALIGTNVVLIIGWFAVMASTFFKRLLCCHSVRELLSKLKREPYPLKHYRSDAN